MNTQTSIFATGSNKQLNMQQQLNALHQISIVLSRSLDLEDTLRGMLQTLSDVAHLQYGLVSLFDHNRSALFIQAVHGVDAEVVKDVKGVRYRVGEGIMGTVMHQGQSLVIPRVADDPRFLDRLNLYIIACHLFVCRSRVLIVSQSVCWRRNRNQQMNLNYPPEPVSWKW